MLPGINEYWILHYLTDDYYMSSTSEGYFRMPNGQQLYWSQKNNSLNLVKSGVKLNKAVQALPTVSGYMETSGNACHMRRQVTFIS